jgi:hypothetical protein
MKSNLLLNAAIVLVGLLLLGSGLSGIFMPQDVDSDYPPPQNHHPREILMIAFGLVTLFPVSLSARNKATLSAHLICLSVIVCSAGALFVQSLVRFSSGAVSWHIIPVSVVFFTLSLAAPAKLLIPKVNGNRIAKKSVAA